MVRSNELVKYTNQTNYTNDDSCEQQLFKNKIISMNVALLTTTTTTTTTTHTTTHTTTPTPTPTTTTTTTTNVCTFMSIA